MHHLIVREHEHIVLAREIGEAEGHLVVVVAPEVGIQLHVLEEVMHPAHVPLEGETETVVLRTMCDHGPGRALLGNDHAAVLPPGDHGIQVLEELNRLEVLVAAVFVRAPLTALSAVVQIEHRCDGIDPESVYMVFVHPVERIRNQEVLDLGLAVIKNLGAPVRMLALSRIGVLVERLSVEIRKAEGIPREMRRHPVKNHADARRVQCVDKSLKFRRAPVAGSRRVVAGHLIAPTPVKRILRNAHEFHMGIAHVLDIGREFPRQGLIGEKTIPLVFIAPPPGTEVTLVNAERFLPRILLCPLLHPRPILPPVVPGFSRELRRRAGAELRRARIGVCLVEKLSGSAFQKEFVEHPGFESRDEALPDAALKNFRTRICLCLPVIELADHAHRARVRCPDRKVIPFHAVPRHGMRTELLINLIVRSLPEQITICLCDDTHTSVDFCHTPSAQRLFFMLQV